MIENILLNITKDFAILQSSVCRLQKSLYNAD